VPRLLSAHQGVGAPTVLWPLVCIWCGPGSANTAGNSKLPPARQGPGAPAVFAGPGRNGRATAVFYRRVLPAGAPTVAPQRWRGETLARRQYLPPVRPKACAPAIHLPPIDFFLVAD
jgi:hypothetical protein